MKHLREYEEEEIRSLVSDLKSVGQSDWAGFYITHKVGGDEGAGANAIAIVGENWKWIAEALLEDFGIPDPEDADIKIENLNSIDSIMESIDNFYGSDFSGNWNDFTYKFWEMNPKKLENSIESADLLDTGDCLEMGRRYFSDFDSVILRPRY